MALYLYDDLTLEVIVQGHEPREDLERLLHELAWVRVDARPRTPSLRLFVHEDGQTPHVPPTAHEVFRAEGFRGLVWEDDCYLTDGASSWHIQGVQGQGHAYLAPSFREKPVMLQRDFWVYGLLKLLRPLGLYSLHAAGLISPTGQGLLLIGASGCGKSTLTISLMRQEWRYVSDDAVLLRLLGEAVEALTLRRHAYLDADATAGSADLPFGAEVPDTAGKLRRRVHLEQAFPGQLASTCLPQVLLFPTIVPKPHSALFPLDRPRALQHLLTQSGPQLFDRRTMGPHLEVLKRLVQQAVTFELQAGRDLYEQPGRLVPLLQKAEGAGRCPIS